MLDPIISLAIAMQSDSGVYALLVGSGLSRSAGIPTGWEIVLDLIRKLALLMKEDCGAAPDEWYRTKFAEEPDYARLLDQVANTPTERQQLLRGYFEPDEEREEGLKVPTAAHHAIADLVKRGYVKVILTTNFDRLIEKALEAAGVSPTVISSTDQILGTRPLAHSGCTVVKLHGDYLDTRVKNTPAELAKYDKPFTRLLDRVFDEYGLVVSGWSGQWDEALRHALERCSSHRFTTFWTTKVEPVDAARKLIQQRRAVLISIEGADPFFTSLHEKVVSLEQMKLVAHPLSTELAVATLKRYLAESRHRIKARDLVIEEARRVQSELASERFPISSLLDDRVLRMKRYEALMQTLLGLFITGAYWGETDHESTWLDALGLVADFEGRDPRRGTNLQDYPALLLMYGAGISAVAANKYGNLAAVLIRATRENRSLRRDESLADLLSIEEVVDPKIAHEANNSGRDATPVSDYLASFLREPFRDIIPRDRTFDTCFDRFEYILTLVRLDLRAQLRSGSPWMLGRYLWRDVKHYDSQQTELEKLYREMNAESDDWAGLRAGLFGGSLTRLQDARDEFDEGLPRLRQNRGIWT